ncbi:hypothetical protein AVEN_188109-1, partial [Araneus ventricosus]
MAQAKNQAKCPIIGNPKELSCIVPPTLADILLHYTWIRKPKDRS